MPPTKLDTAKDIDPVTFSVILSRFTAIADEMTITLERSAWTSILAVCRDFSCAVYDAKLRQVASHDAMPIHTTSMQLVLAVVATAFEGEVNDGDVFLCNDAYSRNTHVGDLVTAMPVYWQDQLVFWSVTRGHQMDTGAALPSSVVASARNVWQEGLQIPPTKLVDRGVMRDDLLRLYLANVRYSELLEGDLLAQLGSIDVGRQRLVELCDSYGGRTVEKYLDAIIDYADRRMTQEVAAMPDGVYRAEGWVDSDGYGNQHIPVRVTVEIRGDRVCVDFSASGPQGQGGVNGSYATSLAAGAAPFLYYIDPDIPHNHGCIRHIDVKLKEGTICHAVHPASTSTATVIPSDLMQDVVNRALVAAMPERVPAGSTRSGNTPQFSGADDRHGQAWGFYTSNNSGGMGASAGTDGWPCIDSQAALGGLKTQSVEQIELLYPVRIEALEIEPDSMGMGQWNGGPGTRMVLRSLAGDMLCIAMGDGCANPPHGVLGGTPGIGGGQYAEDVETGARRYVSACGSFWIRGDREVWIGVSTGGGGYGRPIDRDPERVRHDARDGLISRMAAEAVFGVVLTDDPEARVDVDATDSLRGRMRELPVSPVQPMAPDASEWVRSNLRPEDVYLVDPPVEV